MTPNATTLEKVIKELARDHLRDLKPTEQVSFAVSLSETNDDYLIYGAYLSMGGMSPIIRRAGYPISGEQIRALAYREARGELVELVRGVVKDLIFLLRPHPKVGS